MSRAAAPRKPDADSLAARFWGIARSRGGSGVEGDSVDPVKVVRHVLTILDALDRGESGEPVSVRTISFLKLLRESEQRGDLSYAAPEQISGEVLDERSLVFSVGVLLFERLTGRHPFGAEGNHPRRVARIRRGEFGSGVNYFPTVPQALRSILMRAMGPFPEERWSTLRELRAHLEQFVDQEDPQVVPLPGTTRVRPEPGKLRRATKAPKFDKESTRVVDMSSHVRDELLAAAARAERDSKETSGLIENVTTPTLEPAPRAPSVEVDTRQAASSPSPAIPRPMAPPSPRPALTESELLPDLPRADYVPSLRPKAPNNLKPFLWAGAGAALASVAFFLLSAGSSDAPTVAATSAAGAERAEATETASAAEPAPAEPAAPSAAPVAAPAGDDQQRTQPLVFDPARLGQRALRAGADCLTPSQRGDGVGFGMGLLVGEDGRVRKVYFAGANSELPWKQRKCMQEKLVGLASQAPPESSHIVQYHARIDGDDLTATVQER